MKPPDRSVKTAADLLAFLSDCAAAGVDLAKLPIQMEGCDCWGESTFARAATTGLELYRSRPRAEPDPVQPDGPWYSE